MADDLDMAVHQFVAEQAGESLSNIHLGTTLLGDLGITGDDAYDFFVAFADRFNVDVSSLDLFVHFDPEGSFAPLDLFTSLWAWFRNPGASVEERSGLIPIHVSDLVHAVCSGKWTADSSPRQ